MSTPLQNRLVGTVIVAAAVIIFLPDLLDGKKKSNQTEFDAIPQAPTFTGKVIDKPFPQQKLVRKEQVAVENEQPQDAQLFTKEQTSQTAFEANQAKINNSEKTKVTPATKATKIVTNIAETTKKSAIDKPVLGQQPTKAANKKAWVIQLGSFKHQTNVAELVTKLKRNGYSVFTKPIKTKQGTLTKVFVGPELIQASLVKKLPALKTLTNVQGKIARFQPTK
ncbi:cell division protein DedD [Colwellia sp. KU-HH00111]|uniref:SPOR domain-containing protein n=1 Tax=Colwellia sp. KU-HH00111 TaxID=3127652 RepID=UPI0031080AAB